MRSVTDGHYAVLSTAKEMLRKGLVEGTSGNISARLKDGNIVCTPASVDYQVMVLEDLVVVDPTGELLSRSDGRSPTSEVQLHLACYQAFEDVGSVVHAHPIWASMFACSHEAVPACVDEFTIYVGGEARCAAYSPSGSPNVGKNAVAALQGRSAALLANHGIVAVGASPSRALHIVALVERTAQIAWGARVMGGIVPIPDKANEDFSGVYELMRAL